MMRSRVRAAGRSSPCRSRSGCSVAVVGGSAAMALFSVIGDVHMHHDLDPSARARYAALVRPQPGSGSRARQMRHVRAHRDAVPQLRRRDSRSTRTRRRPTTRAARRASACSTSPIGRAGAARPHARRRCCRRLAVTVARSCFDPGGLRTAGAGLRVVVLLGAARPAARRSTAPSCVEARFGFNRMTLALFCADLAKRRWLGARPSACRCCCWCCG